MAKGSTRDIHGAVQGTPTLSCHSVLALTYYFAFIEVSAVQ